MILLKLNLTGLIIVWSSSCLLYCLLGLLGLQQGLVRHEQVGLGNIIAVYGFEDVEQEKEMVVVVNESKRPESSQPGERRKNKGRYAPSMIQLDAELKDILQDDEIVMSMVNPEATHDIIDNKSKSLDDGRINEKRKLFVNGQWNEMVNYTIRRKYKDGSNPLRGAKRITNRQPDDDGSGNGGKPSSSSCYIQETIDDETKKRREKRNKKKIVSFKQSTDGGNGPGDEFDVDEWKFPYSATGVLVFEDCGGELGYCTATLIGNDQTIITAGHCVPLKNNKICTKFWETATFYASFVGDTDDVDASWSSESTLFKLSTWVDTQKYPDVAVISLTNPIPNVGYLNAIKANSNFFDVRPGVPIPPCIMSTNKNMCPYLQHDVTMTGYGNYEDDSGSSYDYYDDYETLQQKSQNCRSIDMDYTCFFPRVKLNCYGEEGDSGAPIVVDDCGKNKPKKPECMYVVAIYKGYWCDSPVATALGHAWKAVLEQVYIPGPNTKAPTMNPVTPSKRPTFNLPRCRCGIDNVGNGVCDLGCFSTNCQYDGGDCNRLPSCLSSYCTTLVGQKNCIERPVLDKSCKCTYNTKKKKCMGV